MIAEIINTVVDLITQVISFTSYGGIFFLMLVESCGIPVPSEIIMPFSGFLVSEDRLAFWPVVIAGTLGNLGGSLVAYWIGMKGGRPLLERYGKYFLISTHDLEFADRWFKKYGNLTAFTGRLLPIVRTYISFSAGIARMNVLQFSFYSFLGALLWSIIFTRLGVSLGAHWETIREQLHNFDILIAGLIVITLAWFIWRHLKRQKSSM